MTYTTDIPISGDTLGSTRDRIRGNFQEIAAVEAINHVAFNNSDKGKHKFLQMPEQVLAPTTLLNEGGLYTHVGTNPAETNLFFRAEDSVGTGGFRYQLTAVDQTNIGTFANNTAYATNHLGGWTFLPGGLLLQYGTKTNNPNGGDSTITFPKAFKSSVFSITISFSRAGGSNVIQSARLTAFSSASLTSFGYFSGSNTNTPITWMAIGI
jgi:hypothetical protein